MSPSQTQRRRHLLNHLPAEAPTPVATLPIRVVILDRRRPAFLLTVAGERCWPGPWRMIQSMTGYGEAQHAEEGVSYALELRSLNNRYFKANVKLPENLQFMEADVEKLLRTRLQRGSVTYVLRVRNSSAAGAYEINRAALEHYLGQVRGIPLLEGVEGTVDLASILTMPGVCQPPEQDEDTRAHTWEITRRLTEDALERLVQMRGVEGEALREDLLSHCARIRGLAAQIAAQAPAVIAEYQDRLRERVAVLLREARLELETEALLREVAVFADRSDISEEVSRLASHLDQFTRLCDSPELAGRKLDFLAQEMLREANTIGSKSNNAAIARDVVEIKGSIDRLKEQVQNVE